MGMHRSARQRLVAARDAGSLADLKQELVGIAGSFPRLAHNLLSLNLVGDGPTN